ncbi:MAG: tetratricopeptide repeat protein [Crocinitomicaceae bacterium]
MKKLLLIILIGTINTAYSQTAKDYKEEAINAYKQKDYSTALKAIEKSIKLDPKNPDSYCTKAQTLYELKKYKEAYQTYNDALAIFPKNYSLYFDRGNFHLTSQEFDFAIRDFTSAMEFAKNDTLKYTALLNRASAKLSRREFESCYDDLIRVYKFDSTNIGALTNLGAVCDEVGRGDETLKYLIKAVEVDSMFEVAYGNIGFKYQEMGQYEEAIKYFNKLLKINPDQPLGYSNRSYNKLKLGDLEGAMTDIEKSLKLYPANSYAYRIRALIYIEKGNTNKACIDLQTAIEKGFTVMYGDEVIELQKKYCKK